MNTRKLRRLLGELRRELADSSTDDSELATLLESVEQQVDESISRLDETDGPELDHDSLWERMQEARERFEQTHPKLTSIVGDILDALSENRL